MCGTHISNGWSNWDELGDNTIITSIPSVGREINGRLWVFAVGKDDRGNQNALHIYQTQADNGWTPNWKTLGANLANIPPTVISTPRGTIKVFAVWNDGSIRHTQQTIPGGPAHQWNAWDLLCGNFSTISNVAAGLNLNNDLEVLAVGSDGKLYHRAQTKGWIETLETIFPSSAPIFSAPALGRNVKNKLVAFIVSNTQLYSRWQV